jgi:very-short-patch-repair endonuclease
MTKKAIGELILKYLEKNPESRSKIIANNIDIEKKTINSCLYGILKNKVKQDAKYRWSLVSYKSEVITKDTGKKEQSNILLARLSRYYLSCIGFDDEGLSTFLKSDFSTDYEELDNLPEPNDDLSSFEKYGSLKGKKRSDLGRFDIFFGYPCLVRYAKSKKSSWEGYFLEPIFYYPIDENNQINFFAPIINPKAIISLSNVDKNNVMNEIAQFEKELGFEQEGEIVELDDMCLRLQENRPEWKWVEKINIDKIGSYKMPLKDAKKDGIYNRPILILGEKSRITQGLEHELKQLENLSNNDIKGTALETLLYPKKEDEISYNSSPLLEILPMNAEQRDAVNLSLNSDISVITGPPGTGKSQVISNLVINAAHRGQRVLFTSKNNKAVDVVETRVNALASRPILIRVGSQGSFQLKLAEYILDLISSKTADTDLSDHNIVKASYEKLTIEFKKINKEINLLIETRNRVDKLEQAIDNLRSKFGENILDTTKKIEIEKIEVAYNKTYQAYRNTKKENANFLCQLFWFLIKDRTKKYFEMEMKNASSLFNSIGMDLGDYKNIFDFSELKNRISEMKAIREYDTEFQKLNNMKTFEDLNLDEFKLIDNLNNLAESLWKLWIKIQPSTITREDRESLSKYQGLLKMIVQAGNEDEFNRSIYSKYMRMLSDISHLLPCWAVTSLSAKGRIPFAPGIFDLVIFDEASQCDIASALPLLYRAKAAVVIGDPKQLTHITSLKKNQDYKLLEKNKLEDDYINWAYSFNSLFNLAATYAGSNQFVKLMDHHRSHKHIIDFSNEEFYNGDLRVATNYDKLKRPVNDEPGIRWVDVKGAVLRPPTGGAFNGHEAKNVLEVIYDLLVNKEYKGSIGVVSPFRSQANFITKLVFDHPELSKKLSESEFISDTVHKFQGDERDVIIFSPVLAKGISAGSLHFLKSNGNLFNVAITRARAQLIVVGDLAFCSTSQVDYLSRFAKYYSTLKEDIKKEKTISYEDLGPDYPKIANSDIVSNWEKVFYQKAYEAGFKLIPQYQIEKYTVDFLMFHNNRELVIEIDGERYHKNWNGELCRKDQLRNQRLFELGYDVKRFWVYQVRDDMDGCLKSMNKWLES